MIKYYIISEKSDSMAFDGVFTHCIKEELQNNLLHGRINKIYQISNFELLFMIRAKQKNQKLLISIHPNYARIHLTKEDYPTPQEPPMFCMLLRKHLENGIIKDIKQKDCDRILEFHIEHMNEIGDKEIKRLIIEIMGKHSNIILVNIDNRIIDSIKHISPFLNSYRTLQPGADYLYPPNNDKVDFFKAQKTDFEQFNYLANNLDKQLINYFEGVSPLLAKELLHQTFLNSEGLYKSYEKFINKINNLSPAIINTPKKSYFYLFPLESITGEIKTYPTLSDMLDRFFFNKENSERIKQQTQDLKRFIKNELEKNINKLNNLETDLYLAEKSLDYKKYGDLIIASSYNLTKGQTILKAQDYETLEEIIIELDPLLTPIENSQKYYTKYQKAKSAINHLNEQIKLTNVEITYFETLAEQIENAQLSDALEIRQELEEAGYLKPNISKQKKAKIPKYETYEVDDALIFVGKNNIQNDYITHKLARKNDYFMHVKDMPGSHIIIRKEGELTENIIRTAANLAAYYSKGKLSSSVPVDYTLVKYVKKVPGAKLGFVTYTNQKTIYIDPDEDLIHKLKPKKI